MMVGGSEYLERSGRMQHWEEQFSRERSINSAERRSQFATMAESYWNGSTGNNSGGDGRVTVHGDARDFMPRGR